RLVETEDDEQRVDVGGHDLLDGIAPRRLARDARRARQHQANLAAGAGGIEADTDPVADHRQIGPGRCAMLERPGDFGEDLAVGREYPEDVVVFERDAPWYKIRPGQRSKALRAVVGPAEIGKTHVVGHTRMLDDDVARCPSGGRPASPSAGRAATASGLFRETKRGRRQVAPACGETRRTAALCVDARQSAAKQYSRPAPPVLTRAAWLQ